MSKPKILFVGEGNFSYAASEVTKTCHTVVATALLGGKPLAEKQCKNIQHIKDHGGLVFLDVDATLLSEHSEITSMQFQRIQFNFPHVGGKMNIKANRALVRQFFESCRKLVDLNCLSCTDGQVWVTLCAGQGGTLADTKQREWHNTWQVVPLAESAQFGLVDVQPFCTSECNSYHCTGYRGQDKGFHVVKALVHIFEYDAPFSCPVLQDPSFTLTKNVQIEDHIFQVPCFFAKLFKRNLLEEENSPVQKILSSALKVLAGLEEFSYICNKKDVLSPNDVLYNSDRRLVHISKEENDKPWVLLPSVQSLDTTNLRRRECTYTVGRTFLHTQSIPVQHQIWLMWTEDSTFCPVNFIQTLLPNFYVHTEDCKMEFNHWTAGDNYDDYFSFVNDQVINKFKNEEVKVVISAIMCYWVAKCAEGSEWVGTVFKIIEKHHTVHHLCLKLDAVAMVRFGIDDWRVFWTQSGNYRSKIPLYKLIDDTIEYVFRPKTLFPTFHSHDISFWLPNDNSFDELKMILLLRSALLLALHHVVLLEEHWCQREKKKSRCYRIGYQSREGSLSKEHCNKIHLNIRNLLASKLKVILR